jgi:hypothetical protein
MNRELSTPDRLRAIKTLPSLIANLRDETAALGVTPPDVPPPPQSRWAGAGP